MVLHRYNRFNLEVVCKSQKSSKIFPFTCFVKLEITRTVDANNLCFSLVIINYLLPYNG